ncbi:CpaF family protein [Candidatus Pacearchaeota archaeon]|nr:CpaF family protein [Candidatus Pacearchaeota archaeon]
MKKINEIRKGVKGSEEVAFGEKVKDAVNGKGVADSVVENVITKIVEGEKEEKDQKILESYEIKSEGNMDVTVRIKKKGTMIIYDLEIPEVDDATSVLLEDVRNELISLTTVGMREIVDPDAVEGIRKKFSENAGEMLMKKIPTIGKDTKQVLVNKLMQDMLGLGEIEFLVNDSNLEEIVIPSAKEPLRVYHKKYGWLRTSFSIKREDEIINYSNIVARRVGRQITVLSPLLDAHLVSGDRVNAVLYPISTKGNTITIRRFARDPYTIIDLIGNKTMDLDVTVLLWLAVEYEMNVIVSGGTASGKTVILNACMPFIPPNHRILTVEDTRELMLPDFLYWTPLVTRSANPEGKGAITMLDLLVNSLRMRPDRIVLGEMRRQEEAMVMFEAMHTGHSVYATMHANSASETVSRLINPPLSIPANLLDAVNLNVVMFRDRRRGIRRILQVGEFNVKGNTADANIIYRWIPEGDKIIRHGESSRFFEDISRNTGMTQTEIDANLEEKKKILAWLIKHKIRSLSEIGKVMNYYYSDKARLIKEIQANNVKLFASTDKKISEDRLPVDVNVTVKKKTAENFAKKSSKKKKKMRRN